jgi:hypothetical protein
MSAHLHLQSKRPPPGVVGYPSGFDSDLVPVDSGPGLASIVVPSMPAVVLVKPPVVLMTI